MKKIKKKGFTLVELVIVIAVIAILAGVLIGTFASVLKRAKDSADIQNIKNAEIAQKADDIIKKIEDSNWFGWEDFEASIVAKITDVIEARNGNKGDPLTAEEVETIVKDAVTTATANLAGQISEVTEAQVKAIVENAIGTLRYEGVTEAQVRAIVNAASNTLAGTQLSAAQVRAIVTAANEKNLTAADIIIGGYSNLATVTNVEGAVTALNTAITTATSGLATGAQVEELKDAINQLVLNTADVNDVVLAKSLNIKLAKAGLTTNNVDTPYDVVEGILDKGSRTVLLNIDKTNEKLYFIAVDTTGKVLYSPEGETTTDYKYWAFVNDYDTSLDHSQYLLTTNQTEVTITTGIDVGETRSITSITYDRHDATDYRSVVIRTNGGTLTIAAPNDDIAHYGYAGAVNIVEVKSSSYHENGTVPFIQISKGNIVLEETADVNGIHVANVQTIDAQGNIEKTEKVFTHDVVLTLNGADVKLTRDAVGTDLDAAVLVCEVKADSTSDEYIWLYGNGTIEDAKVYVTNTNTVPNTEVASTTTTQNASAAAVAIANNATNTGTEQEPVWTATEGGKTAEAAAQAAMFKGEGTETSPYEINNGNDWYNLLTKYQGLYMGSSTTGLYVVLKGDVDITGYDITSYNSYPRNFHLDGNGFTMKNFETSIWGEDGTLYLTNTFTNLKLENCHSSDNSLFGGTQNSNTASVTFNNVDLNNCSAVGGAYQYYDGSATATFIDCDATNTNVLGGYMASGGFIGNISTGVIVIDHCSFGGSVVSTQSACGGFIGQSANYDPNKITIKDSTLIAGTVIRNVAGGNVAAFNAHTGTQDYAQFNNNFYGTLETTGTKYKQGTDAATKTYEPVCTATDFTLNSAAGTLTYNGSAGLGKIAVQVYVTDDYIYNGEYYGGYNWYVCDPIKANSVVNGTTISGIPVITDFYNVVSSTDTPVGLQTTDNTYVDQIYNGTFYFDAQTYSWGHYMLGGTYKDGVAVEPTSLKVYIKVTVYDNSGSLMGVVSGATLNYSVDLSNHGN